GVGAGYSPCPPPGILELDLANVRGLETLGAACHLELHLVTFRQTLEALRGDGAEVDEDVLAALLRDEAEALRIVEPLDSTVCHTLTFPSGRTPVVVFRSPEGVAPRNSRANKNAARTGSPRGVCLALISEDELPNLELTRTSPSLAHAAPQVNRSGPQCHRRPRWIVVQAAGETLKRFLGEQYR